MPSSDGVYFLPAKRRGAAADKRRHSRERFAGGTHGGSRNGAPLILERGKLGPK